MRRLSYGGENSRLGWGITHITPESEGGGDELSNLRPLHSQADSHLGMKQLAEEIMGIPKTEFIKEIFG